MTATDLAIYSMAVMAVPAGLSMLAILFSLATALVARVMKLDQGSALKQSLDKAGNQVFYVAFISVMLMNLTMIGLFLSAIWALVDFIAGVV